jgi:serine kinase of HPr protein (carbohydrate metabolism regulator)
MGKSDLALRLIERGARLVADDRVVLAERDGALWASAPAALAGVIEARGVGLLRYANEPEARVALVVDLLAAPAQEERLPEKETVCIQGVSVVLARLWSFASSTPAKIQALLQGRCCLGVMGQE